MSTLYTLYTHITESNYIHYIIYIYYTMYVSLCKYYKYIIILLKYVCFKGTPKSKGVYVQPRGDVRVIGVIWA